MERGLVFSTTLVMGAYLMVTGILILFRSGEIPGWPYYLLAHAGIPGLLWWLWRKSMHDRVAAGFLHWFPVLLFPALFKEVEVLAVSGNWRLTGWIQAADEAVFSGKIWIELSETFPWPVLSEFLHFCYFLFVLLLPGLGSWWFFRNRLDAFREMVFLVSCTFAGSYLFFVFFPVDSPFYLSPPLPVPLADGFFYQLVHLVSGTGGARGGAFPSTHVSVASVIWWVSYRHDRRVAALLSPFVLGLIVATVYGRFHYALDAVAGLLVALLVILSTRRLRARSRTAQEPRVYSVRRAETGSTPRARRAGT